MAVKRTAQEILELKRYSRDKLRAKIEAQQAQIDLVSRAKDAAEKELEEVLKFIEETESLIETAEVTKTALDEYGKIYSQARQWMVDNAIPVMEYVTGSGPKPKYYDENQAIINSYDAKVSALIKIRDSVDQQVRASYYAKKA